MKLAIALMLLAAAALVFSRASRGELGEWARELSDGLVMLLLRGTSGFAADVPGGVIEEERERRLRWRIPTPAFLAGDGSAPRASS